MNDCNLIEDLKYLHEKIKEEQALLAHKPMLQIFEDQIEKSYIQYDRWLINYQKGCMAVSDGNAKTTLFVCYSIRELIIILKSYDNLDILKDSIENNKDGGKVFK